MSIRSLTNGTTSRTCLLARCLPENDLILSATRVPMYGRTECLGEVRSPTLGPGPCRKVPVRYSKVRACFRPTDHTASNDLRLILICASAESIASESVRESLSRELQHCSLICLNEVKLSRNRARTSILCCRRSKCTILDPVVCMAENPGVCRGEPLCSVHRVVFLERPTTITFP